MREGGDDLLHVMRDEEQGGGIFPRDLPRGEALKEGEEMFARDGVEAGAGFVEDEHGGLRHERAGDEDALAFALREDAPVARGEVVAFGGAHDARGFGAVGAGDAAPVVEHGVFSTDDDEAGGVPVGDLLPDGRTDEADAHAEFAPVGIAVGLAEQLDLAGARREVAGECAEERSLARAVRAEDDPVLAALHVPIEPVEDERAVAMDDEAADVEDGAGGAGHWKRTVGCWRAGDRNRCRRMREPVTRNVSENGTATMNGHHEKSRSMTAKSGCCGSMKTEIGVPERKAEERRS